MVLKIYKCKKCEKEFIIIDDYARCCINCKSEDLKVTTETNKYSLYNNRIGMLME